MAETHYLLLLNESLKNHILALPQEKKKRLQEKFEFLENGIWDSGVKVKKLKGTTRKIIFEARLTKGDRILFTLGKHNEKTAIYVWGIVKHDEISLKAESIIPSNAPFLNFKEDRTEEFPEIMIDALKPEYYTQEDIEEKTLDDYGPQKWLIMDDKEWERILSINKPENFEIYLFLTREQQQILKNPPPVLLSGTAGSGKTTIAVYYLLQRDFMTRKRLFVTYNSYLKRFSSQIYAGLIKGTEYETLTHAPDFYTFKDLLAVIFSTHNSLYRVENEVGLNEFETIFRNHNLYKKYDTELVWEEIRAIIKGAKPSISVNRYKTLVSRFAVNQLPGRDFYELKDYLIWLSNFDVIPKIERMLEKRTSYKSYAAFLLAFTANTGNYKNDDILVLQEILKILEKKENNFSKPLLSIQEYLMLGKKRAPNFLYNREEIYSIAEYYQDRLEVLGLRDEIDNCKTALQYLTQINEDFLYDLVICDEVQDFSDIQLALIFKLARDYKNILLAGDPRQIINPSGFRWEEVKAQFYERGIKVPEVFNLNLNFRCVGNIVKLANSLLDLKQHLIGLSGSEFKEEWKFNGKPPVLISDIKEAELINELKLSSAGKIILVRDQEEQQKLKHKLNTELVFTINEAKGLEFDTVLLWKFSADKKSTDIWRRINHEHYLEESHYPFVKHEINLLYVAVTRARNTLIIYDGTKSSQVWNSEKLNLQVFKTTETTSLKTIWSEISLPEEWEKQGDYFFEREYYPAAFECFKNSNSTEKLTVTEAFIFEIKGEYQKAAERFAQYNFPEKAAINYEKAHNYKEAFNLWKILKNKKRIKVCQIKIYEERGEYRKAAAGWLKLKEFNAAYRNWEKGGEFAMLGKHWQLKKDYKKAASYYERALDYGNAAACLAKIKETNKAAEFYFIAGDYRKAIPLYKKSRNTGRLIECYTRLKDHLSLARLYENEKDFDKAIEQYRCYAKLAPAHAGQLRAEAEKTQATKKIKAALLYSALENYENSAYLFMEKKLLNHALREFKILNDYSNMADCYVQMDDYYQAGCTIENSDEEEKWELSYSYFYSYINENNRFNQNRADQLFTEAQNFYEEAQYHKSLSRYKAIFYINGTMDCYLKLRKDEEALHYFFERNLYKQAETYIEQCKKPVISFPFIKKHLSNISACRWYYSKQENSKYLDIVLQLSLDYLQHNRHDEVILFLMTFTDSFQSYYEMLHTAPPSFYQLIIEIKNYNLLLKLLWFYIYSGQKNLPESLLSLPGRCKELGTQNQDKLLLALSFNRENQDQFEALLKDEEPMPNSIELFRQSRLSYSKAVGYFLEKGNLPEAADTYTLHSQFQEAGSLWEKQGDMRKAGFCYKNGNDYKNALRCFNAIDDQTNIAKTYEKMGKYDAAVRIWEKLGKKRELARLSRKPKNKPGLTKSRQQELF